MPKASAFKSRIVSVQIWVGDLIGIGRMFADIMIK
jgi:hypothetical protein